MKNDLTITSNSSEFRKKLLAGVDLVADLVGSTMGPFGRNVLIERKVHIVPIATNDGKRVAKAINPKDPIERMAVRALTNAAEITDLQVGDGTTGTIVLAQAIIHKVFNELPDDRFDALKMKTKKNLSVVQLRNDINDAKDKVLKKLEKIRKRIKTLPELTEAAITSAENKELGEIVAQMVKKVGENGHIFVEEGFTFETQTEIIEGMKFGGKVAANFMINNPNRMETKLENVRALVSNHTLKDIGDFIKPNKGGSIFGDIDATGEKQIVLMAWKFEKKFLNDVADMWRRTGFKIYCIKVPSILTEQLKDIAIYVGAGLCDEHQNMKLTDIALSDLGKVTKLVANAEETILVGGSGKKTEINKRIGEIKEQIKVEKIPEFKPRLEQRIADLASGVGIIRIGHKTQLEQLYVLDKIQDAVLATKEALKEGIVKGGGLALKEIAESLPENILTEPLKAPYLKIQENAGKDFEIPVNIVDPYNVVKTIVENACSIAGTLITTAGGICDAQDFTLEDFKEEIKKWSDKIQKIENPEAIDPSQDR